MPITSAPITSARLTDGASNSSVASSHACSCDSVRRNAVLHLGVWAQVGNPLYLDADQAAFEPYGPASQEQSRCERKVGVAQSNMDEFKKRRTAQLEAPNAVRDRSVRCRGHSLPDRYAFAWLSIKGTATLP
jgi:hypothetical protein